MNTTDYVSLKEISEQLNMDRSYARKYILGLGITPVKRRTVDSSSQLTLTVTRQEFQQIKQSRLTSGFSIEKGQVNDIPVTSDVGVFYFVQIIPEFCPERIKLGFTSNMTARMQEHKTSAPTATILKTYPCKRCWEQTIIDCLTSEECKRVLNEVYEFQCSLDTLLQKAETLFALLPSPTSSPQLSVYSPLYEEEEKQ